MKNILIVEDEANISDFVKGELEYEGYNVALKKMVEKAWKKP